MLYWKDNKFCKEEYIATVILEKEEFTLVNDDNMDEEHNYESKIVTYKEISWIHDKEW